VVRGENRLVRRLLGNLRAKQGRFKKSFKISILSKVSNHVCVLFVQHLFENALDEAV